MTDLDAGALDDVPTGSPLSCGDVCGPTADRYGLAADGEPCGADPAYIVRGADGDGRDVAVCWRHVPEREHPDPDGRDGMPTDSLDRTPDDYDVSDHPAATPE